MTAFLILLLVLVLFEDRPVESHPALQQHDRCVAGVNAVVRTARARRVGIVDVVHVVYADPRRSTETRYPSCFERRARGALR